MVSSLGRNEYSVAEAKAVALGSLQLPQLAQFKQLAQGALDLAASYRQAGDEASAQAALQTGLNLGQRLATGQNTLILDLVTYFDRLKVSGEYPTMQWLVAKYGKQ
jgi:hypothetical protein